MSAGRWKLGKQQLGVVARRSFKRRLLGLVLNVAVIAGALWWWHPAFLFDRDNEADIDEYCALARDYEDALQFSASTPDGSVEEFGTAAAVARDMASVSPPEIREAQRRLADAATMLADNLAEARPETMLELTEAANRINQEVADEVGDLGGETAAVTAFAKHECNLTLG